MRYLIPFAVLSIVFIFGYLGLLSVSPNKSAPLNQELLSREIVNEMTDCEQQSMRWKCFEDLAKELYRTYSIQDILAAAYIARDEPVIFKYCHIMGHFLGREAYKQTQNISEALKQASFICVGGSIHGAVEGYIVEQQWEEITDKKLREFVLTMCQSARNEPVRALYIECIHWTGHVLMFITGNDLPLSLKLCDVLPVSSGAGNSGNACYTGVFMENNLSAIKGQQLSAAMGFIKTDHPSDYLFDHEDPLYPCSILEKQYLPACYQYGVDFSIRLTNDFNETIKWCSQVPDQYQSWCFSDVGRWATIRIQDYAQVKAICDETYTVGRAPARSRCINGVVANLVDMYGGDMKEVGIFCDLFEDSWERDQCYNFAVPSLEKYK